MTDFDAGSIAANARLYLRPVHFVDSPQRHDGETARLAGAMLWFSAVEVIVRQGGGARRFTVFLDNWPDFAAGLADNVRDQAEKQFVRLTSPRAPLQLGERTIRFDQPHVMGILNITEDSFSDGGKFFGDPDAASAAAVAMAAKGASIIDVGGESTRPGAKILWEGDEVARVEPVIAKIRHSGTAISVDTRKALVMERALAVGAHIINDISALLYDDRALEIVLGCDAPVILMHAPSQSGDPHAGGEYDNVALDVYDWLEKRVADVVGAGVARDRIMIDPGIGFGKSLSDNLAIINSLTLYHAIGCPVVFGASRKRMIGALSGEAPVDERLGGSLYLAMKAVEQGVQIVRVHDVAETVQAIRIWRGLRDGALTARA